MSDFTLVDLSTQYEDVLKYVMGRAPNEIIEWMSQFGVVQKIPHKYDDSLYSFLSHSGTETAFRFDESGRLIVFHHR